MTLYDPIDSIIYPSIPIQYEGYEIPPVLEFRLPDKILSLDWSDEALMVGNSLGVTILSPKYTTPSDDSEAPIPLVAFICSFQHLGSPALLVCTKNNFLAAAHPDFSISMVNLKSSKIIKLEGSRGHSSFINSIDIDANGIAASTGDDRTLLIWEDDIPKSFTLSSSGKIVRFWDSVNSDRLIILEAGNKISLLDWRKKQWLLTIYVGGADNGISEVKDIGVYEGEIVAIGNGWWKSYNIQLLSGGCGYTPPTDNGRLVGSFDSSLIKLNNSIPINSSFNYNSGAKAAYIGINNGVGIYDISNASEHASSIEYNMGVKQFNAISFNSKGDTIAISSGKLLAICRA